MERGLVKLVTDGGGGGRSTRQNNFRLAISIQYAATQLTYSTGRLVGRMALKVNVRRLVEYFCVNSPTVCLYTCHKISLFRVSERVLWLSW